MYYDEYIGEYIENGRIVYPDPIEPYTWFDVERDVRDAFYTLFTQPDPYNIDNLTERFMEEKGQRYVERDKPPSQYDIIEWYYDNFPDEFDEDALDMEVVTAWQVTIV